VVLRQAQDERVPSAESERGARAGPAGPVWTAELGERFLDLVRETGNVGASARALGYPNLFNNRMQRHPEFRRRVRAAAFDWARDERAAGRIPRARPAPRAAVRWSVELGERFIELVRETGNARQAAMALGAPNAFNNRMKRHPEFARRVRAAAAEADGRLRGAGNAFPFPFGIKGKLPTDAEALGGYLRPGRKPRGEAEPVLRRNSKGRMQVTLTREGHWTSRIEADFLARLAATGNFEACAVAVGFQGASVHERVRKWPAFARDCERALEEADVALTYRQVAYAHALMRRPGEAEALGIEEEEVPFDPAMAMKILAAIDARKYGRSGKGRRKGPPERSFREACDSILAKIEAIERHERLSDESGTFIGGGKEGGEEAEEGSPPCQGGED
jgi:hypothetical protein